MIGRIRDRRTFERLRTSGQRLRRGPLTVTYLALDAVDDGPAVAFAIGRRFGSAVARNRARRRLRSAFRAARLRIDRPVPYAVLVQARPSVLTDPFDDLVRCCTAALTAITDRDRAR